MSEECQSVLIAKENSFLFFSWQASVFPKRIHRSIEYFQQHSYHHAEGKFHLFTCIKNGNQEIFN
jgi:hypothetical protein